MDNGAVVSFGATGTLTPRTISKLGQTDEDGRKFADASAFTIEAIAEGETDERVLQEREEERKKRMEKLKLVKDETQSQGAVSAQVYLLYIRALGGVTWLLIIVFVYILAQVSEVGEFSIIFVEDHAPFCADSCGLSYSCEPRPSVLGSIL